MNKVDWPRSEETICPHCSETKGTQASLAGGHQTRAGLHPISGEQSQLIQFIPSQPKWFTTFQT